MKHCKACNINILDTCNQCPLCGGAVVPIKDNTKSYTSYPVPQKDPAIKEFVIRLLLAVTLLLGVASVAVNLLLEGQGSFIWWPIVVISLIYAWLATKPLWKPTRNSASIAVGETILTSLYILTVDYCLGFMGWSVKWGLPIVLLAGVIAAAAVYIFKPAKRAHYALFEIIASIFAFIPIILYYCNVPQNKFLALGCAAAGVCCVLMTWVVGGQETKNELSRRFKF